MLAQADHYHPDLSVVLKHLLFSGGKRIRPTVALLTGGMLGGDPEQLVILAAAVELLHTATLVHDDLIDGAILRRGIATLNAQWSPAATVLTGDFIFARAAGLAADIKSVTVMHLFAETLATIVNGEITQLFTARGLANLENYNQRIYAKTASLFELTSSAAAILSSADERTIEQARQFGYYIGMAFQIVDDILDFIGDPSTVGKPLASDLRQGLVTMPVLYYLDMFPDDPDMHTVMQGVNLDEATIKRLVAAIRESGAIQQAMQDARQFVDGSLDQLADMPDNEEHRALESLARFIVSRRL